MATVGAGRAGGRGMSTGGRWSTLLSPALRILPSSSTWPPPTHLFKSSSDLTFLLTTHWLIQWLLPRVTHKPWLSTQNCYLFPSALCYKDKECILFLDSAVAQLTLKKLMWTEAEETGRQIIYLGMASEQSNLLQTHKGTIKLQRQLKSLDLYHFISLRDIHMYTLQGKLTCKDKCGIYVCVCVFIVEAVFCPLVWEELWNLTWIIIISLSPILKYLTGFIGLCPIAKAGFF